MKKIFVTILACGLIFTFSSCKKDYICECTYSVSNATQTISLNFEDMKKKDAEDACASQESLYRLSDENASCKIK